MFNLGKKNRKNKNGNGNGTTSNKKRAHEAKDTTQEVETQQEGKTEAEIKIEEKGELTKENLREVFFELQNDPNSFIRLLESNSIISPNQEVYIRAEKYGLRKGDHILSKISKINHKHDGSIEILTEKNIEERHKERLKNNTEGFDFILYFKLDKFEDFELEGELIPLGETSAKNNETPKDKWKFYYNSLIPPEAKKRYAKRIKLLNEKDFTEDNLEYLFHHNHDEDEQIDNNGLIQLFRLNNRNKLIPINSISLQSTDEYLGNSYLKDVSTDGSGLSVILEPNNEKILEKLKKIKPLIEKLNKNFSTKEINKNLEERDTISLSFDILGLENHVNMYIKSIRFLEGNYMVVGGDVIQDENIDASTTFLEQKFRQEIKGVHGLED